MTGGEHDHLEFLICFFKTFHDVGSDVNACLSRLSNDDYIYGLFVREVNFKDNVWIVCLYVVHTMYQSLIHVKNQQLCYYIVNRYNLLRSGLFGSGMYIT